MGINQTLKALADPVRRNILEMLKQGPKSAGEIAQAFEITETPVHNEQKTTTPNADPNDNKQTHNEYFYNPNI